MSFSVSSLSLMALVAVSDIAAARSVITRREFLRPQFGTVPYGTEVISCTQPGVIALTFDDGPGPLTEQIVNTLESAGAKGTFFVVGKNGEDGMITGNYDGLLQRMHKIGSHSYTHPNFNEISYDEKIQQLVDNEDAFSKILGFIPTYFRPPFTACNGECYQALGDMGYHVTDYDLDTKDWEDGGVNAEFKYASAVKNANPQTDSFIALAHDIQDFTANGFVKFMLDVGAEKGFRFVTLGECLGDPSSNWYRDNSGNPGGGKFLEPEPTPSPSSKAPESTKEPEPSTTSSEATPSASAGVHKEESSSTISSATASESTTQVSVVASSTIVSESSTFVTTFTTESASTITSGPSSTGSAEEAEQSSESNEDGDSGAAMPAPSLANILAASFAGLAAWALL